MIIKSRYHFWGIILVLSLPVFVILLMIILSIREGFNSSYLIILIPSGIALLLASIETLTYHVEYKPTTAELIIWHYFKKSYIKNPRRCKRKRVIADVFYEASHKSKEAVVFYKDGKKVGKLYIHLLVKNHDALYREFW